MKILREQKESLAFFVVIIVVAIVSITIVFSSCYNGATADANTADPSPAPSEPQTRFGIVIDSFEIVEGTIQRNEFLSNILDQYQVDNQTTLKLAQKARNVFSVRNLAVGNPYTILCKKDSLLSAQYFVYQPNPVDYVVYDLRDTLAVYTGKRKVTTKTLSASGVISGSLYETLEKMDADPALAMKLADIYAWTIDFYSIQKGDSFRVIYDQQYIRDEPVETGQIRSAVFVHGGEEFNAFYFKAKDSESGEYFNEEGQSLRKAFLKAPLKFSRISSRYSLKRFHPVQKRWKAHLGTDYAAPYGTPIISTGNGVVIDSRFSKFNGNYVKIRHNSTYTTQYLHMRKRAVKKGQHVSQGQVIGYVGSTGLATGPHVCYRFWKNNKQVDPLRQVFPPARPVSSGDMPAFKALVAKQLGELGAIQPALR